MLSFREQLEALEPDVDAATGEVTLMLIAPPADARQPGQLGLDIWLPDNGVPDQIFVDVEVDDVDEPHLALDSLVPVFRAWLVEHGLPETLLEVETDAGQQATATVTFERQHWQSRAGA